jgi:uncharacterized DUF497 family protein
LESQQGFSFDWDLGNSSKSFVKHGVSCEEVQSVFYQPETIRVLGEQTSPKVNEPRYGLVGMTIKGKVVFVCFTLLGSGMRIVSVRELNRKERIAYEELL